VAAGVVEGADLALAVADGDDVISADLQALIGAGLVEHAGREGIEPFAVEDRFEIGLEDFGRGIEGLLERMAGAVLDEQVGERGGLACHIGTPVAGEGGISGKETFHRLVDNWQKSHLGLVCLNSLAICSFRDIPCLKATEDAETL